MSNCRHGHDGPCSCGPDEREPAVPADGAEVVAVVVICVLLLLGLGAHLVRSIL